MTRAPALFIEESHGREHEIHHSRFFYGHPTSPVTGVFVG